MTSATLNYSQIHKLPSINWKIVCFSGFVMLALSLIFYVYQISSLTKGSYLIANYEKEINKLSQENKNLEVSFAESSFLGQVMQKVQELNFQKTISVKYIQILDSSVAISKNVNTK